MQQALLDQMIEFAVAELASGDTARIGKLVRSLAQHYPGEKALMLCFALISAAAAVEDVFRNDSDRQAPNIGYKLSALVAADILAIELLNNRPAKGVDLLHFWRRVDPYFLQT